MASIKLANGGEVKELRMFDGIKWVVKRGKVYDGEWKEFVRQYPTFQDDMISYRGLIRQANSGLLEGGKLIFDMEESYSVSELLDDMSGSPGNNMLLKGDSNIGFYGEVNGEELFNGIELSTLLDLTAGGLVNDNTDWFKFAYEGKILFYCNSPIRGSISHDNISAKGLTEGSKIITRGGVSYKVRLFNRIEWDNLIRPISQEYNNLGWDINYSLSNLGILTGNYSWVWINPGIRIGNGGVNNSNGTSTSANGTLTSWRPVLEVIE